MYRISGESVLFDWLAKELDANRRQIMLDWLVGFAQDPLQHAQRIPAISAPTYLVLTSCPNVVLKFLHAEIFHVVLLIEIRALP